MKFIFNFGCFFIVMLLVLYLFISEKIVDLLFIIIDVKIGVLGVGCLLL